MINIAICDDEPSVLYEIHRKVEGIMQDHQISASYDITESPSELLDILHKKQIDILLLDIDMPVISGLEVAKVLSEEDTETLFIFITNQEALVYESFHYHPFGFIRKSCYEAELGMVLVNAIEKISKRNDSFIFKSAFETTRIKLADILYFEADSNYVMLYAMESEYRYRETLQNLETELNPKGFIRIHKGYLVNQQAIHAIRCDEVELINHRKLPIGRSNRDYVRSQLMKYMR